MEVVEIIGNILLLLGAFFVFTGAVGINRMPDFFSRLHPAGISDALGLPLMLLGVLCHMDLGLVSVKIMLIVFFAVITSATACHALAKVALISGMKPRGQIKANVEIVQVDEIQNGSKK